MQIQYEKRILDNGLNVIVCEERSCPIVSVNLWYHVGSKNEKPGSTGFAHLFEHLMFEGSEHHDKGYFYPLQEVGGTLNGSTSTDRTNYWEVVPVAAFERALWMESDRMGFLLPALTQKKFDNQRDVVLNERRQNYENRPYGLVPIALMSALYPEGHPYSWVTIGEVEDIQNAHLDDVKEFFANFYHPANASIAIAGDVRTDEVFRQVNRYFGEIAPGPVPPALVSTTVREPTNEIRLSLTDDIESPRLYLSWLTPSLFECGDAEFDILGDILAGGKSSRLYRSLVHEREIALDVSAGQGSRELSSSFSIVATASPGHTLDELEAVIMDELLALMATGPTESEVECSIASIEADFVYRLQSVGGFGGLSDQLNAYNVYTGNPGYFEKDRDRYTQTDTTQIKETATRYLKPQHRVALGVVPETDGAGLALSESVMVHPK